MVGTEIRNQNIWNQSYTHTGQCSAPGCVSIETIEHIINVCKAYTVTRQKLLSMWLSTNFQEVYELVLHALTSNKDYLLQFILDCSSDSCNPNAW